MNRILYLLLSLCIHFNASSQVQPEWTKVGPGIWKTSIGKPDAFTLLSATAKEPKSQALNAMPAVGFPLNPAEIKAWVTDGKTFIHFPIDKEERIFGLGLQFKSVEQRGRIMRLHVDHYGGQDNGRTHAPVPFYVSSKGYGVLINAARYIDVWVGTAVTRDSKNPPEVRDRNTDPSWDPNPYSDNIEILVPAEGAEILIFGGPDMIDAVRRYNLFNGGGCLPPRWGLGFWHRTPTLYNYKDILNEVSEYARHHFPLTVIGLEPGWQSKAYPCTYEWDKTRFPDPGMLIDSLQNAGIYANLWMNPYISPESELYTSILPFSASHTVWSGLIPDYSMPGARQLISEHLEKHVIGKGVSGFKMDENDGFDEWLWPDVTVFPSGHSAEQMRQTYALMMQKMTTDLFHQRNTRTYGLVRASNAGASSFPFVIYNDYYSHPDFITALINSSFIGVLWTPEVRSSKTAEEWLRRIQTVCFSPMAMINAWADGTKPWSFPEVETLVNFYANLRMQLIPYLYTSFADYTFYGTPPIRAIQLEPGFITSSLIPPVNARSPEDSYHLALKKEIKDQFVLGDNLLVAPLFAGQSSRQVVLPSGKWYDFYTGTYAGEAEIISTSPGSDNIPVYVRDGGIIPMMASLTGNDSTKQALEIRVYGQKESRFELYDDDGVSFDYEQGKYTRIRLSTITDKSGKLKGCVDIPKAAKTWSYKSFKWKFMTNTP